MLAASAAFRAAGSPVIAADVVGSMLTRWHYISLAAPLALFAIELRNLRRVVLIVIFSALMLAALQSFVDLRIRVIRNTSVTPVSELDRSDPVRRRFGMLHGLSMMLLALQAVAAGIAVAAREPRKESAAMTSFDADPELEDDTIYKVVVNQEEQYSIWPADREAPMGWSDTGFQGPKAACLQHIQEIWSDMRPRAEALPPSSS
jgi:MbtH protein